MKKNIRHKKHNAVDKNGKENEKITKNIERREENENREKQTRRGGSKRKGERRPGRTT